MNSLVPEKLKNICFAAGFTRRGKAFFRVAGDGVFQVIKLKYERVFRADLICIGLFSMYDQLLPQWFTATGCIPRYSVVECAIQATMPLVAAPPMSMQIDLLQSKVMLWLDSIDTQKKLSIAVGKVDRRWNDGLKFGPYLACGEANHAKKVAREILAQHATQLEQDFVWFDLLAMLDRADPAEIGSYLKANYARNMEYAKFCIKTPKQA